MPTENDTAGVSRYTYVPADCLTMLPFKSEAIIDWKHDSDLSRFAHRLSSETPFDVPDEELRDDDYEAPPFLFNLADQLTSGSRDTYHQIRKRLPKKILFRRSPEFGGFAKALIAWRMIESELLSEGGFFSLAHTLEALSDLECGLELVKLFYYRQATICLRTFLEDVVHPLYFFFYPKAYKDWQTGNSKLPRMRGKDGILADLHLRGSVTAEIRGRIDSAYNIQNRPVHGAAGTLINEGTLSSDWRGHSFKADELYAWMRMAKECIECGFHIVKKTSDLWSAARQNGGHFCSHCHSTDYVARKVPRKRSRATTLHIKGVDISLPLSEASKDPIYRFRCKNCGATWYGSRPEKRKPLA